MPDVETLQEQRTALALAALAEVTDPAEVGGLLAVEQPEPGVVDLRFACTLAAYAGWSWTVSTTDLPDQEPTVLEVELLPGGGALLAPPWVPWTERLAEWRRLHPDEDAPGDDAPDDEHAAGEVDDDDLDDDAEGDDPDDAAESFDGGDDDSDDGDLDEDDLAVDDALDVLDESELEGAAAPAGGVGVHGVDDGGVDDGTTARPADEDRSL